MRALVPVMFEVGETILSVRSAGLDVKQKDDLSPVTEADQRAEKIIEAALGRLAPDIPMVGEEAVSDGRIPDIGACFFLVDPLDGTKEFISGRSEFTVNIALIENRVPVLGLVYAPVLRTLFFTPERHRAARLVFDDGPEFPDDTETRAIEIKCQAADESGLRVVASRSHLNEATKEYLERFEISELVNAGSSLKFCLLAEGKADLYPRLSPTMEWDTAAGQAVLEAAGGSVTDEDGNPLLYRKLDEGFLNGNFIALGRCASLSKKAD